MRHDRTEIRETCRALSDKALAFQLSTSVGGMHREELERERASRRSARFAAAKTAEELRAAEQS